ncbi:carboxypeptidase-like regulatory domain-containing protein [Alistipes sp. An54]|uniref:carboxypeptidase-like regulatory domain-containing protein n=1 Tax=Alistipes sp. An54 TaxID=1965645 RepID=UPI001F14E8BE|nr:carboxypeptidase-like regulatory domain-containing protein [Alistipes sp. An54]
MKKILLILAAILLTTVGFAQNKVSGVVMDDNSEPLAGVAVLVKGTQKGGG